MSNTNGFGKVLTRDLLLENLLVSHHNDDVYKKVTFILDDVNKESDNYSFMVDSLGFNIYYCDNPSPNVHPIDRVSYTEYMERYLSNNSPITMIKNNTLFSIKIVFLDENGEDIFDVSYTSDFFVNNIPVIIKEDDIDKYRSKFYDLYKELVSLRIDEFLNLSMSGTNLLKKFNRINNIDKINKAE